MCRGFSVIHEDVYVLCVRSCSMTRQHEMSFTSAASVTVCAFGQSWQVAHFRTCEVPLTMAVQ